MYSREVDTMQCYLSSYSLHEGGHDQPVEVQGLQDATGS